MKLSLRYRIVVGVALLVLAGGVAIWLIAGGAKTASPTNPGVTTTTAPTAAPVPTVRPGSTETVIDISATDPLLPYLAPGVHIDMLKLTPNGSGGQSAQVIATDLVVIGVQATGVGTTPPAIQTAVPTAAPGAAPVSGPVVTPQAPTAGLVVDVPSAEEGALLPAQSGYTNIAYVIVGTAAAAPVSTPVPTSAPTATATPSATPASSPTGTPTASPTS